MNFFNALNIKLNSFIHIVKTIPVVNKLPKIINIAGRYSLILFTSLSILFTTLFYQPLYVYASNNEGWTTSQKVTYYASNFAGFITQFTGAIFNPSLVSKVQERVNSIALAEDYFGQSSYNDWVASCLGYSGTGQPSDISEIEVNQNLINTIKDATDYVIQNDTGFYYAYSCGSSSFLSYFNSQDQYHAFLNFINSHDDSIILFSPDSTGWLLIMQPANNGKLEFVYRSNPLSYITSDAYYNWESYALLNCYYYESDEQAYIYSNDSYISSIEPIAFLKGSDYPLVNNPKNLVVDLNSQQYIVYKSFDSMRSGSEGVQDYYLTDSYNTNHVDNSQTITKNQIDNSISYNNVQNWVNNYYVQNTTYPSSNDVYNYINNYEGGGSGGGGSGSGSDDDDDDGWDWGFLDTIAGFFKGLLKALKTALEGILDLLTGVIDLFIGEEQPDGTRTGGIPTIIGKLVAHFLPMLPDWCTQLIGFSVLLSLILGIVKLIRGH